jgi:hypothetical protein
MTLVNEVQEGDIYYLIFTKRETEMPFTGFPRRTWMSNVMFCGVQ